METIQIPLEEYQNLQKENQLLKKQDLLVRVNQLIDILFESKYGLYMGDYTDDLTEVSSQQIKEWEKAGDIWNEL